MKKILLFWVGLACLLFSFSAQSKEYSCDMGEGGHVNGMRLLRVDEYNYITLECNKKGEVILACGALADSIPECKGNASNGVNLGHGAEAWTTLVQATKEHLKNFKEPSSCDLGHGQTMESNTVYEGIECINGRILRYQSDGKPQYLSAEEACQKLPWCKKAVENEFSKEHVEESKTEMVDSSTAGKILDEKTASQAETQKNMSEENTNAPVSQGSATSGKVAYTGPSSLTAEYYYGCNSGGNIFQQLACRAGQIGLGLRSVGYIIAGFGLLVFSFAALFGKVKWNVFATIMFSVFLLSMTFFVINTFTKDGNSAWIAGIAPTGFDSAEQVYAPTLNVDGVSVPDAENNRPK